MNEQKNEPKPAAPSEPGVDVALERDHKVFRLRVPQRLHRQALREFKEWKHTLTEILRRESRMAWSARNGNPSYQFVLPAKLVRLVWSTTINERVKMEMLRQPEGAALRAMEMIRAEIEEVVEQVVVCRPDATKAQGEDDGKEEEEEGADQGAGRSGDEEGDEAHPEGEGEGQGRGLTPVVGHRARAEEKADAVAEDVGSDRGVAGEQEPAGPADGEGAVRGSDPSGG